MISRFLALLVIPVIAFSVAACGGGGEAATTNSAATPAERYLEITAPRNDECIDKVAAVFEGEDDSVLYSEEVVSEVSAQWGECEQALREGARQIRSVDWPDKAQGLATELAAAWEEEADLVAQFHKAANRDEYIGVRARTEAEFDANAARGRKAARALRAELGLPSPDGSQDPGAASTSSTPGQDGTTTKQADPLPDETDATTEASACSTADPGFAELINGVLKGNTKVSGMQVVKSSDYNEVYFIAGKLSGPRLTGDDVAVWSTNSLTPGDGVLLSANGFASEFSDLGTAKENRPGSGDAGFDEAVACAEGPGSTSSRPGQDGTTTKQADPLPDETDAATGSASEANPCQDELDMLNRYSRSTHPEEKADSQWLYRNCLYQNGKGPDPGPLPG